MITKDKLELYAERLMFRMSDEELDTLEEEFKIILKQMEKIGEIEGISQIEPMTFPFITNKAKLREDVIEGALSVDEVLSNTKHELRDQVKVPKVVE